MGMWEIPSGGFLELTLSVQSKQQSKTHSFENKEGVKHKGPSAMLGLLFIIYAKIRYMYIINVENAPTVEI